MKKDYDSWNNLKKKINAADPEIFYHKREIWWCSLGNNIGSEQDGTGINFDRPVLVVRGFNKKSLLILPLSTKIKTNRYYFLIGKIHDREASVVLSQIRLIDSNRLIRKIGTLDKSKFDKLKTALIAVLND